MAVMLALDDATPPRIECAVDAAYAGANVNLRGRIVSPTDASGRYRLEIRQVGKGGSSNISQAGEFRVNARESGYFGSANLNAGGGIRLIARFTVEPSGDAKTCVVEREISDE